MDPNGRLLMPGFTGETFKETGVLEELKSAPKNRKERRRQEVIERQIAEMEKQMAAAGGDE